MFTLSPYSGVDRIPRSDRQVMFNEGTGRAVTQGARMAKQKQESEYTATASFPSWLISSLGFTFLSCDSGEIVQLLSLGIYQVEGGLTSF